MGLLNLIYMKVVTLAALILIHVLITCMEFINEHPGSFEGVVAKVQDLLVPHSLSCKIVVISSPCFNVQRSVHQMCVRWCFNVIISYLGSDLRHLIKFSMIVQRHK